MLMVCLMVYSQDNGNVPTKVYVGGIPFYSTEDDIRSFFENCGTITEVDCMKFPESGKFRGIAMITFKVGFIIYQFMNVHDNHGICLYILNLLHLKISHNLEESLDKALVMLLC